MKKKRMKMTKMYIKRGAPVDKKVIYATLQN